MSDGLDSGHWFWGTTLYLAVLLTVLGKAALISEYVINYTSAANLMLTSPFPVCGPSILLQVSHWYSNTDQKILIRNLVAIPGSFVFTMLFLPLYAVVAPAIGFSTEYEGIVPRLWTNIVFYFVLILIPIFCLARDFAWK